MADFGVRLVDWVGPEAEILRKIRLKVFVEEQGVPEEEEVDAIDAAAVHALAEDWDGRPVGTARLYDQAGDPTCARIGRMAVLPDTRNKGCGTALLQALLVEARRRGYQQVVLSAQDHAVSFYERHGFAVEGESYLDANIPHYFMRCRFP